MNAYLLKFRDQAFEGAFSLFKRTLGPNLLITIIFSILNLLLVLPLMLIGLGISLGDIKNMKGKFEDLQGKVDSIDDLLDIFRPFFDHVNIPVVLLAVLVALLIYSWMHYAYLKLNDNEVRTGNRSFANAIMRSFSTGILKLIGLLILVYLITIAVMVVFFLLVGLLMQISSVIGILIGFIGFFVVLIFIIRMILAMPALVHGNLSIGQSLSYSFRHITWKRAALLMLMGIAFIIVALIVSAIVAYLLSLTIGTKALDNPVLFGIQSLVESIVGALTGAFAYASLTALYFRYSNDEGQTDDSEHLIVGQ